MSNATRLRLDTVDHALQFGWEVKSWPAKDEFTKDGSVVVVAYSPQTDDVTSVLGVGTAGADYLRGQSAVVVHERLRDWLAGIVAAANETKNEAQYAPRAQKLSWTRERWLHKPTQEIVDDNDPRVPRTIDEAKKQNKIWYMMGSQADVVEGHYRRDMDAGTTDAIEPRYTATWHPRDGAPEVLIRGSGSQAYAACVRHYQSRHR